MDLSANFWWVCQQIWWIWQQVGRILSQQRSSLNRFHANAHMKAHPLQTYLVKEEIF